jgi:hypothetical protein
MAKSPTGASRPRSRPAIGTPCCRLERTPWFAQEALCEIALSLRYGARAHVYEAPSALVAQRRLDAIADERRFVLVRNEQCSESSWMPLNLDRAVVRPPTGPLVLPVAAELDRDGGSDRSRINSLAQRELCLEYERVRQRLTR